MSEFLIEDVYDLRLKGSQGKSIGFRNPRYHYWLVVPPYCPRRATTLVATSRSQTMTLWAAVQDTEKP